MALSNNFTTLRIYNYNSYALEETYSLGQFIKRQVGYSLAINSAGKTLNVLVCNESIIVAYRGSANPLLSFSPTFGSGVTCLDAV